MIVHIFLIIERSIDKQRKTIQGTKHVCTKNERLRRKLLVEHSDSTKSTYERSNEATTTHEGQVENRKMTSHNVVRMTRNPFWEIKATYVRDCEIESA